MRFPFPEGKLGTACNDKKERMYWYQRTTGKAQKGNLGGHLNLRPPRRQAGANRPQAEFSFSNSLLFLSAMSGIETALFGLN